MDVQEEAAERYDRLPWDHLVPPPDPDRRRWLVGGVIVVVLGAFLGFRAGSGTSAAPPPPAASVVDDVAEPPPEAPEVAPSLPPVQPPPQVVASPLGSVAATTTAAMASGIQRVVTEAFSRPGVFVDGVVVHDDGQGGHVAVVSLYEVVDGLYARVPDMALRVRARQEAATVVVDDMTPIAVPEVRMTEPTGEVEAVPDPVSDGLREALGVWPDSEVLRVGNDSQGWWAEVALRLPGGADVPLVIRPPLPVGTGAGG